MFDLLLWIQNEEWLTPAPRVDGDSVRVWVKGHDVIDNTVTDYVLVHVDSSPPVIEDVWLVRHSGQSVVHHIDDLSEAKYVYVYKSVY